MPINRLKTSGFDFNEYLKSVENFPDLTYTDETFSFPEALHRPELTLLQDQVSLESDVDELDWLRISDAFSNSEYSMWGEDGQAKT